MEILKALGPHGSSTIERCNRWHACPGEVKFLISVELRVLDKILRDDGDR